MKNYLTIDKIDAYRLAFDVSNEIWENVMQWDSFARWTLGKQLVEAADSISANIAEGFGRYHKKDKVLFYRYSYGSMEETKDWVRKAFVRGLISEGQANRMVTQMSEDLPKQIHQLIRFTNDKLNY
ncbi:MAG: four helix bundle protein [Lewinellaceae bacterium]|jgi:four helix bundle protein|nr:four helix bundle protein [Lewinellaceae bacterium]